VAPSARGNTLLPPNSERASGRSGPPSARGARNSTPPSSRSSRTTLAPTPSSGRRSTIAPARDAAREEQVQEEFHLRVGEAIRSRRQARGWTQVGLAERASLSSNYVARLERGELGPSLYVAHRISRALGVSINDLLVPLSLAPSLVRPARRSTAR
jgi:putative transcriptional regulator